MYSATPLAMRRVNFSEGIKAGFGCVSTSAESRVFSGNRHRDCPFQHSNVQIHSFTEANHAKL